MSEAHASGAGRGVSQANGAAIHPKLTGLCQHEIVTKTLKKEAMWSCASQLWVPGELVSHMGMGVRISVFAP
jgi:glutaredoxin-related protein